MKSILAASILASGGWLSPVTEEMIEKRRETLEPFELSDSDKTAIEAAKERRERKNAKRRAKS